MRLAIRAMNDQGYQQGVPNAAAPGYHPLHIYDINNVSETTVRLSASFGGHEGDSITCNFSIPKCQLAEGAQIAKKFSEM